MSYIFSRLRLSAPRIPTHAQFQYRNFSRTNVIMGVTKHVLKEGTGAIPKPGDTVTIQYTGWLKDTTKGDTLESQKGNQFDSSVNRGPFVVQIGVGQVIKGWDEGVTQMKLGEKATLDITPDYAYGARWFPPVIPANSTLLFDVELQKIN
ncbi:FKBP-type peptidyl-prolyl cis-trans isomerase [Botrytis cinerea]